MRCGVAVDVTARYCRIGEIMKRTMFSVAAFIGIAGCASVTDVVSTGPDTHMVASQGVVGNGSGASQKAAALQAADSYCKARGEQMRVIRSEQTEPFFGRAPSGQVEFRCLGPGGSAHQGQAQHAPTGN